MSRPGSSLGINSNGTSNTNGNAASNRARRVTIEEKYRQEREREAELDGAQHLLLLSTLEENTNCRTEYERRLTEEVAEADRRYIF